MKNVFYIFLAQILIIQFTLPNSCFAEDVDHPVMIQYKDLLSRYDQLTGGAEIAASLVLENLEAQLKDFGFIDADLIKIKRDISVAAEKALANQETLIAEVIKSKVQFEMALASFNSFSKKFNFADVKTIKEFLEEIKQTFPEFYQSFYKIISPEKMTEEHIIEVKNIFAILACLFTKNSTQFDFELYLVRSNRTGIKSFDEKRLIVIDPKLMESNGSFNGPSSKIKNHVKSGAVAGTTLVLILFYFQAVLIKQLLPVDTYLSMDFLNVILQTAVFSYFSFFSL